MVRSFASADGVEVYDRGVRREKRLDAFTQRVNQIEFTPDGILYGLENQTTATAFTQMRVDAEGVTLLNVRESVTRSIPSLDFALYGPDLLIGDGPVYTPDTGTSQTMNWGDVNFAFTGEPARQRVYVAGGFGFDTHAFAGKLDVCRSEGAARRFCRFGPFGRFQRDADGCTGRRGRRTAGRGLDGGRSADGAGLGGFHGDESSVSDRGTC